MSEAKPRSRGFVALMYHRISDALPPGEFVVPVAKFREQMEWLGGNCEVLDISCLLRNRTRKTQDARRKMKILITFDDGYRDNYLNAYPILKRLKFPATIFLITGYIGTDRTRPRYQHMPKPDMLNWNEVREMAQNGITFGAHTVSHPRLSQLDYETQKAEIQDSILALGSRLVAHGKQKHELRAMSYELSRKTFCYPYGKYNADTLTILKELGVKLAFTVKPGVNTTRTNPLELRRIGGNGLDPLTRFNLVVRGRG